MESIFFCFNKRVKQIYDVKINNTKYIVGKKTTFVFLYMYIAINGDVPDNNMEPIVWLKETHLYLFSTGKRSYTKLCSRAGVGAKQNEINIMQNKTEYIFSVFKLYSNNKLIKKDDFIEYLTNFSLPILSENMAG